MSSIICISTDLLVLLHDVVAPYASGRLRLLCGLWEPVSVSLPPPGPWRDEIFLCRALPSVSLCARVRNRCQFVTRVNLACDWAAYPQPIGIQPVPGRSRLTPRGARPSSCQLVTRNVLNLKRPVDPSCVSMVRRCRTDGYTVRIRGTEFEGTAGVDETDTWFRLASGEVEQAQACCSVPGLTSETTH